MVWWPGSRVTELVGVSRCQVVDGRWLTTRPMATTPVASKPVTTIRARVELGRRRFIARSLPRCIVSNKGRDATVTLREDVFTVRGPSARNGGGAVGIREPDHRRHLAGQHAVPC